MFGTEKLKRVATDCEKNVDDSITRFVRIHERDRQTDRQTDTPHDGIGRAYA